MMDYESQLKLQAYFDGELPENETRDVANWLARDREAVGLLAELRNTRKAVKGFESDIKLPETREFYWSKIERDIGQLEQSEPAVSLQEPGFAWWRRYLVPATAFAVLLLAVVGARHLSLPMGSAFFSRSGARQFSPIETAFADTGVFTYRDHAEGITVVWLSYPGENEIADTSPTATLQ
jgi:anti-sigma factor RsiW